MGRQGWGLASSCQGTMSLPIARKPAPSEPPFHTTQFDCGAETMPKIQSWNPMTADELTTIRKNLGWTQDQLGRALLIPPKNAGRTIRRYESGRRIPGPVDLAVRAINAGFSFPHIDAIRAEASAA